MNIEETAHHQFDADKTFQVNLHCCVCRKIFAVFSVFMFSFSKTPDVEKDALMVEKKLFK